MPNLSRAPKLKTLTILLRNPEAIETVEARSKKERRSKSAALAVIVIEWAEFKSIFQRNRAAARRANSLPEDKQNTERCRCGQGEISPADPAVGTIDAAGTEETK
jgi:hypothetical protein